MPIDLGDSVTRSINLTSSAGAAVDADSLPTYAITLPDGTAGISPTVQHGVTGEYYVVYPTMQSGVHQEVWSASVGGVTVVIRRNFTVEQTANSFIDTAEALAHLRASGVIVSAADLEQLRWLCSVACGAVQDDLGRTIARTSKVETFNGGQSAILITHTPVISITSIVESGITLAGTDYTVDLRAGIVYRGGQQSPRPWLWGRQNIVTTTVVGYTDPPRIARKVALNAVQRMWQSSQQTHHPGLDDVGSELAIFQATGTLTPLELAAYNSLRAPGFA
jgi:hypothetical protein